MTTAYTDNGETISKKAFTRRVNAYKKHGTLYRVTEHLIDGVTYYNLNVID